MFGDAEDEQVGLLARFRQDEYIFREKEATKKSRVKTRKSHTERGSLEESETRARMKCTTGS